MAARQVPEPSRMIEQISLPMSPWNRNALLSLRGVLKISVIMHPVLSMMLEIEEGGFMNRHEAQLVRELQGSSEQMSRLIDILCDKDDMDFNTFLQMLRRANYEVWAIELKRKAEELKREEAHPMSPWNRDALVSLREKLQLRVLMETGLCDLLEKAAGGFMSRVEAMVVREQPGNVQQMGKLIDILCGKDDNDFSTFLQMLRRANYEVWAMVLKMKAEGLKREAHPMSPWNRDALVSLREKLQLSVLMETGLGDRLEEAAGGFMSRVEAMVVREQQDNSKQMGKLIDILCRKGDDDFSTFLQLLHKTHNRVWAKELERKAEQLKRAEEFQLESRPADPDGKAEAEAIEPAAERRAYPEEQTRLWKFINGVFLQLRHDSPIFGILVIAETGTGKSTLINNLLGCDVAEIGHTMESETQLVTPYELTVEGVPVVVYDTPGLDDTKGDDDEKNLEIMKSLLARKKIHLVIYCMKLTETRMRRGLIRTFKEFHKIGVPWEQTVVTITFADVIKDTTARFTQMQQHLKKILVEKVGVTSSVVDVLKICPTAKDPTAVLPSGKQWYVPFWLDVVQVLVPAALVQFLHIHKDNIQIGEGTPVSRHPNPVNITLVGEDQKRFQREVDRLPELQATSGYSNMARSPVSQLLYRPEVLPLRFSEDQQSVVGGQSTHNYLTGCAPAGHTTQPFSSISRDALPTPVTEVGSIIFTLQPKDMSVLEKESFTVHCKAETGSGRLKYQLFEMKVNGDCSPVTSKTAREDIIVAEGVLGPNSEVTLFVRAYKESDDSVYLDSEHFKVQLKKADPARMPPHHKAEVYVKGKWRGKVAMLIANQNYSHFQKLQTAEEDVRMLAAELRRLGFSVLTLANLTLREMQEAQDIFCYRLLSKDATGVLAFVYFAGCGFVTKCDSFEYLMPVDSEWLDHKHNINRATFCGLLHSKSKFSKLFRITDCSRTLVPGDSGEKSPVRAPPSQERECDYYNLIDVKGCGYSRPVAESFLAMILQGLMADHSLTLLELTSKIHEKANSDESIIQRPELRMNMYGGDQMKLSDEIDAEAYADYVENPEPDRECLENWKKLDPSGLPKDCVLPLSNAVWKEKAVVKLTIEEVFSNVLRVTVCVQRKDVGTNNLTVSVDKEALRKQGEAEAVMCVDTETSARRNEHCVVVRDIQRLKSPLMLWIDVNDDGAKRNIERLCYTPPVKPLYAALVPS